jgi:ubiquinone/menaquinone biosynthesis C-methylase UbiE
VKRPAFIARQSARPAGPLGAIIAAIMVRETAQANELAIAFLDPRPGEMIIDIGAGSGRSLRRLAALVDPAPVTGVDHSAVMCARARRSNRDLLRRGRLRVEMASSLDLPFRDALFDGVLSVHTIYFWPNLERQFREIARVLKPDGRAVLCFRPPDAVAADFPASVYRFYTDDEISAAAGLAGLRLDARHDNATRHGSLIMMRFARR